jgi:oxalate decarboxylase/phosphoglucose isomerase-like protein (cupin superfamily)
MNLKESAILPKKPLVNRERKREFYFEASRVIEKLETVNASFIHHLFNEDDSRSWGEIYLTYAEMWNDVVIDILSKNRFKAIFIDVAWFQRQYGKNTVKTKI